MKTDMRSRVVVVGGSVCLLIAAACTESDFHIPPLVLEHPRDNKITVEGGFCAEGADDILAFLKIMFIVDRSNSMLVTDPNTRRASAVGDVVMQFIENPLTLKIRTGVEIALISFYGDVITHTRNALGLPGFSNDGPQIMSSIVRLAQTSSNTGYDKALATAFQILDADMARLEDKARARSRYEVFFLSDGFPFPDNCIDEANSMPNAARGAGRIAALSSLHRISVTLHTAFVSAAGMFGLYLDQGDRCCLGVDRWPIDLIGNCRNGSVSVGQVTRALLRAMADEGGGTFKQFENGDAINFLDFEF
ncbi:MAG: VWA domain-containing protein, partial [Myxococcota bacterium]